MMVSKSSVKIEENINPLNDSIVDKKSTYFLINNNKLIENLIKYFEYTLYFPTTRWTSRSELKDVWVSGTIFT